MEKNIEYSSIYNLKCIFSYLKKYNIKPILSLYGSRINNQYKEIIQYINSSIIFYKENIFNLKKNNLVNFSKKYSKNDKINYLFNYLLIDKCIVFIDSNNLENFNKYLDLNDIEYINSYSIDYICITNNYTITEFINNITCKLIIFTSYELFCEYCNYFDKIIIYNNLKCINSYSNFIFTNDNKKNIYFLDDNNILFNDIIDFYNIRVNNI